MTESTMDTKRPPAELSRAELAAVLDDLKVFKSSNLISVLQDVQNRLGYLPQPVMKEVGRRMDIPLSRIYGVISFYAQFYTEPRGRHTIRCCRGTACHVRDGSAVIDGVKNALGIDEGETTEDMMFTFETVACLGACALAPVMVVDEEYHGKATAQDAKGIVERIAAEESQ